MKIFTSYFAKLRKIDLDKYEPISICGKAPDWYTGSQYKVLAPKYQFFMEWKQNHDNEFYIEHFNKEVLDTLSIDEVIAALSEKSNGKDIVLLCYEKPGDFCHRHLVADWLTKHGYECSEMVFD